MHKTLVPFRHFTRTRFSPGTRENTKNELPCVVKRKYDHFGFLYDPLSVKLEICCATFMYKRVISPLTWILYYSIIILYYALRTYLSLYTGGTIT